MKPAAERSVWAYRYTLRFCSEGGLSTSPLGAAMADAGTPLGGATAGPAHDEGPARQNEIADTLRKLRKLVIFSGEELTDNLPLYLNSESLLEELEARVEDARLHMQGQGRTARATGQRQWLARGVSPERELEKRAAAIGHWDEANAIFRCACVCPACRYRACNRRMWWKLDDHDNHLCDGCKHHR